MAEQVTQAQVDAAKAAGWRPEDGEPPYGWDAHGEKVEGLKSSTNLEDLLDPEDER